MTLELCLFLVSCSNDQSLSTALFILPPLQEDELMSLLQLYIHIHISHTYMFAHIWICVFLLTVYSRSSLNKSLSLKSPALEQDGGRALLELSRRESIPPRPSEMEVALFHATIKLNQYNSIKQIEDLKKRDENKTISFHCEQKEVPPCPLWKIRGIWWLSISWTSLRQRHAKRKVDLYNFVILGSPTRDIKGDWIKDRQIQT